MYKHQTFWFQQILFSLITDPFTPAGFFCFVSRTPPCVTRESPVTLVPAAQFEK